MGDSPEADRRHKRQKRESSYKSKAFERFKQLKSGNRNKYDIGELDNVYDVVDEKEYVKTVLSRQDDDWIDDDGGEGYVEDGRDIFDDDLDSASIAVAASSKGKGTKRKKKAVSENAGKGGNLQLMLSKMPSKKKEVETVADDDMLSEILDELDDTTSSAVVKPQPILLKNKKKAENDYMKTFSGPKRIKLLKPTASNISATIKTSESIKSSLLKDIQNKPTSLREVQVDKISLKNSEKVDDLDTDIETVYFNKESTSSVDLPTQLIEESENVNIEVDESQKLTQLELMNIDVDESQDLLDDGFDFSQLDELENKEATNNDLEEDDIEDKILAQFMEEQESFQDDTPDTSANINVDASHIPLTKVGNDKVFRFFYWDAFEDINVQRGVIFLYGKTYCEETKSYVSCCVVVRELQRKLFVLPRPYILDNFDNPTDVPVTPKDVYTEFNNDVVKLLNISGFKSRFVQKKYAFDPNIPAESDYMEVRYSSKDPSLDSNKQGKTFSKIFGVNSSYLENFLLERKIKGPCWLDIINPIPVSNPVSWCKFEINVTKPSNINFSQMDKPLPPPPLVVATIHMRFALNPKTSLNEIVMISCLTQNKYFLDKPTPTPFFQKDFCVFTAPVGVMLPTNIHKTLANLKRTKIQKMDSEKALLNYFITQYANLDPDLIVGHDLQGYLFSILSDRLYKCDIRNFSKFGRLKRTALSAKMERTLFTGRLICDIKISAKEAIKSRSYDLVTLCQTVLNLKEGQVIELETEDVPKMFTNVDSLLKLIVSTMNDAGYILRIMYSLNVIPLALQITNIAGNIMSRTLMGGRSERNEFLLLHAFHEKDFIVPDKVARKKIEEKQSAAQRKKPTYSGGLVLDPKVGFYDTLILLMDFNSLYPSIIQEYNICFTTLPLQVSEENLILPDKTLPPGVLPTEIRKLVESRREVKKLMKNVDKRSDLYSQYNIRQMALKLTANSMYGCLGFSNSRFFARNLAALVTHKGREILTNTKDLVQKMNFEVIYGDTDSLMINTNIVDIDQVNKIGSKIKLEVNKLYRQVELEIDGVFKYLLLLKKKKYAAVTITKSDLGQLKIEKEYKGLDIVRRDWSQLACQSGKFILEHILSDQTSDERIDNIHSHLSKIKDDFENNRIPLSLLVITKQLTKDPKMYTDKNSLPHVQVALRLNQKHGGHFKAGDTVPYVICEDGSGKQATQRAYHLDELKNNEGLKIDLNYYLAHQIHPVVSRICEPIEGTDAFQIANCLGLDTSSFKKLIVKSNHAVENFSKPEVKFRNVDPFIFKCFDCKELNSVEGVTREYAPVLEKCNNLNCNVRPADYFPYIQNQLTLSIRSYIDKYYLNLLICEDPACDNEITRVPLRFVGKYPVCTLCKKGVMYRKYTEGMLYSQLSYFQYIFDLSKSSKKLVLDEHVENGYHCLRETVEKYLNHSGYSVINLSELFSGFTVRDKVIEDVRTQDKLFFEELEEEDEEEIF